MSGFGPIGSIPFGAVSSSGAYSSGLIIFQGGSVTPAYDSNIQPNAGSLTLSGGPVAYYGQFLVPVGGKLNFLGGAGATLSVDQYIVTSFTVEVLTPAANTAARVSAFAATALTNGSSAARVSAHAMEILRTTTSLPTEVQLTAMGLEVLRDIEQNTRPVLFVVY